MADDIILPEVGQKQQHKAAVPVCAALTSDMHVGSTKFQREPFNRFILWLNGKYGNEQMKEIAGHVKYVLIAGDIVDGVGIYPNQVKELAIRDVYKQYRLAAKYIEQIPDYIQVVIIPGNHDVPRKALPQPAISNEYLETLQESRSVYSLGDPCYLSLHGVEVLMYHGRSLDDVVSTVPGMSNNNPEKAMRLLLQSRHLAPIYGGKTTLVARDQRLPRHRQSARHISRRTHPRIRLLQLSRGPGSQLWRLAGTNRLHAEAGVHPNARQSTRHKPSNTRNHSHPIQLE